MKKILSLSFTILLLSISASAQRNAGERMRRVRVVQGIQNGQITRLERIQLHRSQLHYRIVQRNARKDGMITPQEKRNLQKTRRKTRLQTFRFRHNGRRS